MTETQDTLERRISSGKALTETETEEIIEVLCKYCQPKTYNSVRSTLARVPNIKSYGIYGRVHLDSPASYCAGQSYPDEIRTVRKLLLAG